MIIGSKKAAITTFNNGSNNLLWLEWNFIINVPPFAETVRGFVYISVACNTLTKIDCSVDGRVKEYSWFPSWFLIDSKSS